MSVYIFVGATLPREEVTCALPGAICLPPVMHGDVYRLLRERPSVMGIIDGRFERTPAVWHKEILWAMSEGVHVFGSASMGALRAAELASFGMEGVGAIFADYQSGALTDDDEVAIAEGVSGDSFISASDAMVNIRATLREARRQAIIGEETERELIAIGKRLFYPDRIYPAILERARPSPELERLRAWLPRNRVNLKKKDAQKMLAVIAARLEGGLLPKKVEFQMPHTEVWRKAILAAGGGGAERARAPGVAVEGLPGDRILDELRIRGAAYLAAERAARARCLAVQRAKAESVEPEARAILESAIQFREARGLIEAADHEAWMARNNLTRDGFLALVARSLLADWTEESSRASLLPYLLDHLVISGELPALRERAEEKQRLLGARGLNQMTAGELGLSEDALLAWYLEERLGMKKSAPLEVYARLFGFAHPNDFVQALVRERCFLAETKPAADAGQSRPDLGSRLGKAEPPVDASQSRPDLGSRLGKAEPPVDASQSRPGDAHA